MINEKQELSVGAGGRTEIGVASAAMMRLTSFTCTRRHIIECNGRTEPC